jgi:hypothetical protein
VQVLDRAAALADRVVVLVGARLEARGRSGCRHPPRHPQVGEQGERAVHRLLGHAGERRLDQVVNLLGGQVAAVLLQSAMDDQPLRRDAHAAAAQQLGEVGSDSPHAVQRSKQF